jgi:hypothetical protein
MLLNAYAPRLGLSAVVLLALLVPAMGSAQLSDAVWSEAVSLNADLDGNDGTGIDPFVFEPQSTSLSGSSYSIDGSISFASPGPPNATATISASYQSGLSSFLGGSSSCQILFQFTVFETSPPPVSVATVPVDISATGTADAGGDTPFYADADVIFTVATISQPDLVRWTASANNGQGPTSDSFNETTEIDFGPGVSVDVRMIASCELYSQTGLQPGTSASSTAYVDPVFTIADELIVGGGGASYRDHYDIGLSPGYWALGSTPAAPTTWGKIKKLYTN